MGMPFRSVLLLASFVLANSALGNADPIIVTVTTVGTGTFNSQPFTNKLITFTASLTTETLDACESIPIGGCQEGSTIILSDNSEAVTFTVNVAGFGTFGNAAAFDAFVSPGSILITDQEDRLGLNVRDGPPGNYDLRHSIGLFSGPTIQDELGDNCNFPANLCPTYADTTGGGLFLTSAADTATGEIQVGGPSPIPEPGTLILLGTGLLGAVSAMRRKLFMA